MGTDFKSCRVPYVRHGRIARLVAIHAGQLGVRRPESDGSAYVACRSCANWDTPEPTLRPLYGMVWPAWACVDCPGIGVSRAGTSSPQRTCDSSCSHDDCGPEHLRPRTERDARH